MKVRRPTPERAKVLVWLAALGLSACAPAPQRLPPAAAQGGAPDFRAAFSEAGVAWASGGQACVARAPGYRPVCPRLGRASDVAWEGNVAWALLPGPGLVVTLDLTPRTLVVGAGAALSSQRVYRRDGSSLSYSGEPGSRSAPFPTAAVTGGDGQDYVLSGSELRRVSDGAVVERAALPFLRATNSGAVSAPFPTAEGPSGVYRINGGQLERVAAGQVLSRTPHGPARLGLVRGEVVTVSASGEVRRFTADLRPLF